MASLSFLISFKDETHVIAISNTQELIPSIREKFMISENSVCKLKVFNNDWNEWINVQPHELKGKEKLQLTIQDTKPTTIPVSLNWLDTFPTCSKTFLNEPSILHGSDNTSQEWDSDSTSQEIEEVPMNLPSSSPVKVATDDLTSARPVPKHSVSSKRPIPEDSASTGIPVSSKDSASDKDPTRGSFQR